jgi:RNA polymerase sigma-70 factor (ECF subfamily)
MMIRAAAATLSTAAAGSRKTGVRLARPFPSDARSDERLRAVVEQHFEFVWRIVRRFGVSSADAEDAAQEVFLVLARRLDTVEPERELAFLVGTAVRVASTRRRSARRRREDPAATFDDCEASGTNPEELSQLAALRPLLQEILDAMPLELRSVFVLYELEELTVPAIADLLGAPKGTVSWRLKAAREMFQSAALRLQARESFPGGSHGR